MYLIQAKVDATAPDFPGQDVEWKAGQVKFVHESLIEYFKANPAAWTVVSDLDQVPVMGKKTLTGEIKLSAGGKDISLTTGPDTVLPARLSLLGNMTTKSGNGFAGYTFQQIITVPFAFTGVRLGLPMNLTNVSGAGGVKASIATHSNVSDLSKPNGSLVPVTWNGAANPTFRASSQSGSSTVAWSDVIPITPVARNDIGAGFMLAARVFLPAGFPSTAGFADNTGTSTKQAVWGSLGLPASLYYSATDAVANGAAAMTTGTASMPMVFEFTGVTDRVYTVVVIGDSVMQGFKGNGNVSAFERAKLDVPGKKIAVVNKGWSGSKSSEYLPNLTDALTNGEKYNVVVYESMSVNDTAAGVTSATLIGYIQSAVAAARAAGSRIILVTPFPSAQASAGGGAATAAAVRDYVYSIIGGDIYLCDMAPLHDPATYSKWASGYATDDYHPSEVGEAAMRAIIAQTYARALS